MLQVKFEESEMIPKSGKSPADSRKSVGIHEFAALARSSLNGDFFFFFFLYYFHFFHSDVEFSRLQTLTPPLLPLCFQVSLRQWGTTWPSPPPWLKAGSPTSSSGKVGPSLRTLRRLTPTSAPTATWLKERRRPGSLQVLVPVTLNNKFWILFIHSLLSLGCLAVFSLSRFSLSITTVSSHLLSYT